MTISDIEAERNLKQTALDSQKTALERNILGQFATPNALAVEIVKHVRRGFGVTGSVSFLEPAFGTGSFYSALVQTVDDEDIVKALGVEIDPAFHKEASELWQGSKVELANGDFTKLEPSQKFDLVITNPPYVRHHHIQAKDKQDLTAYARKRFGLNVSGLSGLYCHFIYKAHDWLEDDALSVWLIPSEFMDVNYGASLKEYLTKWVTLEQIHRFDPDDVQFADALVSSAVVIFRNRRPKPEHVARMTFGGHMDAPTHCESVTVKELAASRKWTVYPHRHEAPRLKHEGVVLGDLFKVSRGIATGSNKFFILERELARSIVPEEFLKPVLPSSRHLPTNIVETEEDGYPDLNPQLAMIDCSLPEDVVREKYPRFWQYLEQGLEREIDKGFLARSRKTWYTQENRPAAPLICTYMGRPKVGEPPFRFILNRSKALATNVYLMLYPNPVLAEAMRDDRSIGEALVKSLNEVSGQAFFSEGRVYGGGLHKMEPRELMRLPLVDPMFERFVVQRSLL